MATKKQLANLEKARATRKKKLAGEKKKSTKKPVGKKSAKTIKKSSLSGTKSGANSVTFKLSGMRYFDTAKDALVTYFLAKQKDFFYIDVNKKNMPFGFKRDGKVITTHKDKDNTYMLKITDYK